MHSQHDHSSEQRRATSAPANAGRRGALSVFGTMVVIVALGVLAAGTVSTARSRFAGSTSNEGSLITTGAVDIVVEQGGGDGGQTRFELLFDVSGMVAEQRERRCIVTTYRGSVDDVLVGLHGDVSGGTGLERFLNVTVDVGGGVDAGCGDFVSSESLFTGTLAELLAEHADIGTAIPLLVDPSDGEATTVQVTLELSGANAAQGLTTAFNLLIEART